MKYLTIIRHAKSDWGTFGGDDFSRILAERGRKAAPLMGQRLKSEFIDKGAIPNVDTIISSPATRAITTAKLAAAELGFPADQIVEEEGIYEASTQRLVEIVRGISDEYDHAILFGHNPGFESLARTLAPSFYGDSDGKFPTCGVAIVKIDADSWEWIDEVLCELVDFLYPRQTTE
ncbi:MAG: histidine phosphatase family protein [Verrucomicrobiota bacterium]